MIQCPKCGSREIRGPIYQADRAFASECLLYRCGTCFYEQTSPTLDNKKFTGMPDIKKLAEKQEQK